MISVIIPIYNPSATIGPALRALQNSNFTGKYEIILVDDGSKNLSLVKRLVDWLHKKEIRIYEQIHKGPAAARNLGAKKAKGSILLFLDADVILEPQSLMQVSKVFSKDKKLTALNGIYAKEPANPSFFTWYFSLFKYYQWVIRRKKRYSGFSTRLAAIKKNVFLQLGGFNEKYDSALVEDYEFGHRLGKKYKVIVDTKVIGRHFHPRFSQCFKNYYRRVYLWLKLFGKRKKFDNITTTASAGLGNGFGFLACCFFPLFFLSFYSIIFCLPFLMSFLFFMWFYRRFHYFLIKEKGLLWAAGGVFVSLLLSIPIGLAFINFIISDKLRLKVQ